MSHLLVACLCAEWCGTCRDYQPAFEALGTEFAQHRFVWIDVEDQAELASHIDIENFPTLLIAEGEKLLFAGTMLPHIGHLRRLLLTLDERVVPQLGRPSAIELAAFQSLATTLNLEKT